MCQKEDKTKLKEPVEAVSIELLPQKPLYTIHITNELIN